MKLFSILFCLTLFCLTVAIPAQAEDRTVTLEGDYNVPVPAELRSEATWTSPYCLTFDEQGNLTKITYDLPEYLAPEGQRQVELANPVRTGSGFIELSGRNGLASCSLRSNSLVCLVSYPAITTTQRRI